MIIILVALNVIIDRSLECSMEFVACFPTKVKRQKVLNPVMSVPMSFVNHSPFTRNYNSIWALSPRRRHFVYDFTGHQKKINATNHVIAVEILILF